MGDGSLGPSAPKKEASDQYLYDPANPVPTQGGGLCCAPTPPGGAFDQRSIEQRPDVLVYTSEPFKKDFEVTGNIQAELYVKSSAVDTDLTVKVVDVRPDGYAQNLTDGILRLRYRNSMEKPEPLKPEEIYKVTIDAGPTSNVFLPGHRLRVEVSSSNSPRFDANPNTGANSDQEKNPVKATNIILHDSEHPSAILLPVIPQ
jgi:putative CocE/NonD family hydrolase